MHPLALRNRLLRVLVEPGPDGTPARVKLAEVAGDTAWLSVRDGAWLALLAMAADAESEPGMAGLRARVRAVMEEAADEELHLAVVGGGPSVRELLRTVTPLVQLRRRAHLLHVDERGDLHVVSGGGLPALGSAARQVRLAPEEDPVPPLTEDDIAALVAASAARRREGGTPPAPALRLRTVAIAAGLIVAVAAGVAVGLARRSAPAPRAGSALDASRAACLADDPSACRRAGVALTEAHDPAAARPFLTRGCDGGDAQCCSLLAYACSHGEGGDKDEARARALYQRACDGGDPSGCANLGVLFENGIGGPPDAARATAAFRRGCESHDWDACYGLALHLADGSGGEARDEKTAARLFEAACDGGAARGCYAAGLLHLASATLPRDATRGAALEERGCSAGIAKACAALAVLVAEGDGVAQDAARAAVLRDRACKGGVPGACPR